MCKELFDSSIFVLKAIQLRAHLPKRNPHLVMVTKISSPTVVQLVIPCKLSCTGNGFKKFSYSWWASICMAMSKAISIMRPNTGLGQLFYHTYNMIQRTMKYEHCLGPMWILFPKMEEALLGREPQKRGDGLSGAILKCITNFIPKVVCGCCSFCDTVVGSLMRVIWFIGLYHASFITLSWARLP